MPKESEIRKKAIKILEEAGWVTWHPSKARFQQNDIFGIIDLLAVKRGKLKKIQLTTLPNISTKRKKIKKFFKKNKVRLSVEIWAWDAGQKKFKRERIHKA